MNQNSAIIPISSKLQLTEHQKAAFNQLERFSLGQSDAAMMTLEGYAGTGKTTLVGELLRTIGGACGRVAIAAPTNKAVRVLMEKLGDASGVEYGSIHSFLGLRMQEQEDGQQTCKKEGESTLHNYSLVIIDECSMISRELFRYILTSKGDCLVLFVGDPAQLPPVGDKERSPVFDMVQSKVSLTNVVRQAESNPIIKLSMKIRDCIEVDQMTDPNILSAVLPPVEDGPAACLVCGGFDTAVSWALSEIEQGRDARIIAFTNVQVQRYNQFIHDHRFGSRGDCRFAISETVIAHQGFDAKTSKYRPVSIHTSEELEVVAVTKEHHPKWDDIPAHRVELERDSGEIVEAYVADDQLALDSLISQQFAEWRRLKDESKRAKQSGDGNKADILELEAKTASNKAWAMRKAFAPLRHSYAITAHKSQGSTFDTALVDYTNLCRIKTPFDFNRALYVAITRPSQYLAVII